MTPLEKYANIVAVKVDVFNECLKTVMLPDKQYPAAIGPTNNGKSWLSVNSKEAATALTEEDVVALYLLLKSYLADVLQRKEGL